jgi:hypothetical protein
LRRIRRLPKATNAQEIHSQRQSSEIKTKLVVVVAVAAIPDRVRHQISFDFAAE